MSDNLHVVWNKFFSHRTRVLWDRFPGIYRALVMETNDPLNMYRIRIKCPDMHDFNLEAVDCPWAVPAHDLGGPRAGRFSHPCIGDWVWITFERQHPYAPVWIGFATPTRRKFYSYPQIFNITPVSLTENGAPNNTDRNPKNKDYDLNYLPKDGRPMMHGWQDRYGNIDIHSAVGFYPSSHNVDPAPSDYDPVTSNLFKVRNTVPAINEPDKKYMARVTKYGNMIIMGDQGYYWYNQTPFEGLGEFSGNPQKDEKFERKRWLYLQKLLNEGKSSSMKDDKPTPFGDQRRITTLTRYGHLIEMRDVGWAQTGPIKSYTRSGEYGPPCTISTEDTNDFRWIKIRTKGGMLFQAYDKGSHPNDDIFVKRKLLDEQGHKSEKEDVHWANKDARWMRLVTRYGLKLVLDDRGSDPIRAQKVALPRANGILIKGRRAPAAKLRKAHRDERGFYFEFNENDEANHMSMGTPMGLSFEMNDRYQYAMLSASMGKSWAAKFKGLKENEFIGKPLMFKDPEINSHHLKLDHDNEYIRLKTRAGKGPKAESAANPTGLKADALNQGLEIHDGRQGDGPWLELVDAEHRGFWLSKRYQLSIWRSKKKKAMYMYMDERRRHIVIYNDEERGSITIYSKGSVNIKSDGNIKLDSGNNITLKAKDRVMLETDSGAISLTDSVNSSVIVGAPSIAGFLVGAAPGPGAGAPVPFGFATGRGGVSKPILPDPIEPTDRAKTYNAPFEECPREEIEHPTT